MRVSYLPWLVGLLLLTPLAVVADAGLEAKIKAAYIYKFCLYVNWPESSFESLTSPIVIGVSNNKDLSEELERLVVDRQVNNRLIEIRSIDSSKQINNLHVLYLGKGGATSLHQLADRAVQLPILTISEQNTPLVPRIIDFVVSDDRIRFDVYLRQARQVDLKLSAELLAVARMVNDSGSRL